MSKDGDADDVLVHNASRGDPAAFVELATRWWTPVYRFARNMLGSACEAAEATGQVLQFAVRFPEAVGPTLPFGVSLYGVAVDFTSLRCPPIVPSPAEALRGAGEAETIRGMLQRLEFLDRAAFVLREVEQFSLAETVAILRIPADEVRTRTHRATVALTRMRAPTALRSGSGMPGAFDDGRSQA
jgi:hypothetical protein